METTPTKNPMTFALVAGEHSGDHHGALLIQSLKKQYPSARFVGVGGEKMQSLGLKSLMPMDILSVIGFVAVIKNIFKLLKAKQQLIKDIIACQPDCYIGIDAPDFNLRVAQKIKQHARQNNLPTKIVQYISPTVWAWRPKRIYTVAKATDLVLCIFPFEEKIYTDQQIPAKFVGHPLTQELQPRTNLEQQQAFNKIVANKLVAQNSEIKNLSEEKILQKKTIAVFPGSRVSEVDALAPIFLQTMSNLVKNNQDIHFIVPIVNEKLYNLWLKHYREHSSESSNSASQKNILDISIILLKLYECPHLSSVDVMRASDLILCASGTTTIEALLINVPMVVAYKVSKLNEWVAKLLLKINSIAMPNILADKLLGIKLVPEFLQQNVTAENLTTAIIQELNKYPHHQTNNNWHALQQYLLAGNIDHQSAVVQSIQELLEK